MHILKKYIIKCLICVFAPVMFYSGAQAQESSKTDSHSREAEFYFIEGEKYFILDDHAKALALFEKSVEIAPDNAAAYYKMAQILSGADEPQKALEYIREALSIEKDNKYYYILAADIYSQLGDLNHAAEIYEEITGRLKNTDQYLFELAAIYLYQQKYDEALDVYERIEASYGISEEIITQKQKIYLQDNNLSEALREGERLIKAFPEEEKYVLKQVDILLSNDMKDEALTFLSNHVKEHPGSSEALLTLSELERQSGDLQEAVKNLKIAFSDPLLNPEHKIQLLAGYRESLKPADLEKFVIQLAEILIDTHPDRADSYNIYADILQTMHRKNEAKDAYLKALKLDQSNFAVWQNVLQLLLELNNMDSVIKLSDEALELFPNQGALYYFNGIGHLQQKHYPEAVYALEQGKKLSSANLSLVSVFNSMLGDAYHAVKEYEKSRLAYEAALDYDPQNYTVLNNYSYYLALRKENLEKAEKMVAKAVKDNPDNATFLDTYAWVLFMRGKYKDAKKVIEHAISTGKASAIHYEHYGDILYKLGDIEGAVKQWQYAKGLNPNADNIDKKIADRKLYE